MESGIHYGMDSGIQKVGIRNPEAGIRNPGPSWILLHGAKKRPQCCVRQLFSQATCTAECFHTLQNFHLCFPVKNIFTSAQISLTILIPGFDTLTVSLCFLRCPKNIQVFCHPPPESTVFYAQCTHMIFVIYIHHTIFFISDPTPSSSCNTVFPRGVGWRSK